MFKKTSDFKSSRVSMLVYGESGAGKTTLIQTLPGRPIILNAENGLLSIASSSRDIPVYDLTVNKEGQELDRKQRFEKMIWFFNQVLPDHQNEFDWIVFDSLTEISQNLVEFLKSKYPDKKDALKLWGEYNEILSGFVKKMRDFAPYNILFLALDSIEKDENSRRFIGIDVNGKISHRIPALLDEVFYLKKFEDEEGNQVRKLITSTYNEINAKDRSGKLKQFENPDLSQIVSKIKGE